MSDLRDAVILLSRAVDLLAIESAGHHQIEIEQLAKDARGIAQTVNGVAGKSEEL